MCIFFHYYAVAHFIDPQHLEGCFHQWTIAPPNFFRKYLRAYPIRKSYYPRFKKLKTLILPLRLMTVGINKTNYYSTLLEGFSIVQDYGPVSDVSYPLLIPIVVWVNFVGKRSSTWKWGFGKTCVMLFRLNGNTEFTCVGIWSEVQIRPFQAADHQSWPRRSCWRLAGGDVMVFLDNIISHGLLIIDFYYKLRRNLVHGKSPGMMLSSLLDFLAMLRSFPLARKSNFKLCLFFTRVSIEKCFKIYFLQL